MSWDTPDTHAFCRRLLRRREQPWGLSPGALGAELDRAGEAARGARWLRFAAARGGASLGEVTGARTEWRVADPQERIPDRVREGLNYNQKPFHLWNVERIVEKHGLELEPLDPYRLGGAAADPEPRGMPSDPVSTSLEARRLAALEREQRAANLREAEARRRLWRQPLPFGQREEPADAD